MVLCSLSNGRGRCLCQGWPHLQGAAHGVAEFGDTEWLGKKPGWLHGINRMIETRDKEDRSRGVQHGEAAGQYIAMHDGHLHVADEQIDLREGAGDLQRFGTGRRGQHAVTHAAKKRFQYVAQRLVVIDDENGFNMRRGRDYEVDRVTFGQGAATASAIAAEN